MRRQEDTKGSGNTAGAFAFMDYNFGLAPREVQGRGDETMGSGLRGNTQT